MELSCPHCGHKMRIPKDKLPDAPRFKLTCPNCRNSFVTDRDTGMRVESREATLPAREGADKPLPEPEVLPPGMQLAMVAMAHEGWAEAGQDFFENRGYRVLMSFGEEAERLLKVNRVGAFFLEERPEHANILKMVSSWPGTRRRELSLIVLTRKASSLDSWAAFLRSADAVLHVDDLPRAAERLETAMGVYEERYALWKEIQKHVVNA